MVDSDLYINNYSNWINMESNSALCIENDSGELQTVIGYRWRTRVVCFK